MTEIFDPFSIMFWVVSAIALVLALSVHEFCHALAADLLGDPNPRLQGRLTLNPLKHLDPIGTLSLIFFKFGWGKPVQFDPYNLRHPKRDAALIALAGPISNFIMALLSALILRLIFHFNTGAVTMSFLASSPTPLAFLVSLLLFLITVNIGLGVFNLVPVPPLDGHWILGALLPQKTYYAYRQAVRRLGPALLVVLILPLFGGQSIISYLITPVIDFLTNLVMPF